MDALTAYQERRLELADMVRAVLPVSHAYGDDQREQQIRGLLARLAAGRFQLAVIGQFSRGKTTLMNALLGAAYLPMGALPMTSVVTTVRYGTEARALVRSHAGALPVEVPVAEVGRFVARASTERTRMQVTSVEMEIPAELLRLGFEFVDTPGVGSAIAANTAATLRYVPQADAVVFVTGFDSALTRAEADFLTSAAGQAGKLFVVINKRDLVTDTDAAEVTEYVRRWTRTSLPAEPPVFAISALQALGGAVSNDPQQLAGSGVGPLRDALTRFLTAEQGRVALRNVACSAADLVAWQQRDLEAGRPIGGGQGRDRILAEFDSQVSKLQGRLETVGNRIAASADAAVTAFLTERWPGRTTELTELLALATAPESGAAGGRADAELDTLTAARLVGPQAGADWLERRAAELSETLVAAAADDIGILLGLARSPRELGAAMARLPVFDRAPAGWAPDEIPQLTVPVVGWTGLGQPAAEQRHRRRGRRDADDAARHGISAALRAAVADFAERAGPAFRTAAADWARRLSEQARRQAAAEAAQFRRYLTAPPRDDDHALLADLADRLATFHDSLTAWDPDAGDSALNPDAQPRSAALPGGTCEVCDQLERAQTEYLIRRQFRIATSEADQARHAEAGGFCSLHSWQYAHLSSPVAISAGNAMLASRLAAALREAESRSHDAAELAARVADLTGKVACAVCDVLAQAERAAAEAVAAGAATAAEPSRLCLRHLTMALDACSSLAVGQKMTSALAVALQRASENMRAYALKREALRRGLITTDEASAYADALRLLVGHAALALPTPPD